MRDNTQMPLFPLAQSQRNTHITDGRSSHGRSGRHRGQATQGLVVATAVRRLIAGVVFGLVLVGMLWYFMQVNQQTAALTVASVDTPTPAGVVLVTVRDGDSLWGIAAPHRPSWIGQAEWVREVASANEVNADALFAGQVLAIPAYAE